MKKFVVGAEFMSGVARETGKPFSFGQVGVGLEIDRADTEKFQRYGFGFSIANKGIPYVYRASPEVVKAVGALNPQPPTL